MSACSGQIPYESGVNLHCGAKSHVPWLEYQAACNSLGESLRRRYDVLDNTPGAVCSVACLEW